MDQSCPHCGPRAVELVEHRFHNCPLAQHVWRYVANIIWQFYAKTKNLGPRTSFSMLQCLFYQPLCKTFKSFSRIWFFLRSGLPWIIWRQQNYMIFNELQLPIEKTRQIIALPCRITGGLNGNGRLGTWKKPLTWPTMTFLTLLTGLGGSKVLL